MSSEDTYTQDHAHAHARTRPGSDVIHEAREQEVLDKDGRKHRLGDLISGKRTCLVFIRHFWCMNCQAYVRGIGESIPPSRLPADTQMIGCGTHQPIEAYLTKTSSPYPVYTNPSLSLYELFQFKSSLAGQGDGPTKDYMQSSGSYFTRVMGGVKGALGDMGNISNVGPKSQNGGEVIINKDGECEYIYRMQNTVDHTSLAELASLLCLQGGK